MVIPIAYGILLGLQTVSFRASAVFCPAWLRCHNALTHPRAGKSLASCSTDRTVRIWQQSRYEGRGWRCAAVLEDTHTKSIRCCCWSPGGTHLATASFDGTTAIWHIQGGIWEEVGVSRVACFMSTGTCHAHSMKRPANAFRQHGSGMSLNSKLPVLARPGLTGLEPHSISLEVRAITCQVTFLDTKRPART